MSYTFPDQNAVIASWKTYISKYVIPTNSVIAFFGASLGTITGKTKPNLKVAAIRRDENGLVLSDNYETTANANGDFTITVPVSVVKYAVLSISDREDRNTLIYDWVQPS